MSIIFTAISKRRVLKAAVLLVPMLLMAIPLIKDVSASPAARPVALPLSQPVGWLVSKRDNTGWINARYLVAEICNASGTTCYTDSSQALNNQGEATLTTSQYTGGDITIQIYSWASINGNDQTTVRHAPPSDDDVWIQLSVNITPDPNVRFVFGVPFNFIIIPAFWIMDDFVEGFLKIPLADQPNNRTDAYWSDTFFNYGVATYFPLHL
jgi:hypothetical protein